MQKKDSEEKRLSIKNISCVIIVKNAENTLANTLESLKEFEDIVIYDNGSIDDTVEIAKKYKNVNIVQGEFFGFGPTKNAAATFAKNEWILSLDADEVLSSEFIKNLISIELNDKNIYAILRENYYKDIQVKHCWGDDVIVRLYNKTLTRFSDEKVHEKVIENGFSRAKINGSVLHYPYSCISDFIVKTDRYSTIFALSNVGKKKSSPFKAFYRSLFHFFRVYFFKLGFLDGYVGLLISFSGANGVFFKYLKLYEENNK
ncbi:MAG: glycosyltransferase family 2 protein [Sulfurimonas sp.]|uniref:glycosyltransferase family 2 protein n=1 Tax=Sulfurimonas sp. TaxID=2022749 RepID=UPI00262CD679|nr:glycosyltransferase family 2 protein [Sulfurimonas sp.]MDD2653094.1 glycosyltransferase family 2 protein [Sulfurimonas sp.]MDD3452483.1 glycosyltransferase family 2 protein [Sulfurimonas sp.]